MNKEEILAKALEVKSFRKLDPLWATQMAQYANISVEAQYAPVGPGWWGIIFEAFDKANALLAEHNLTLTVLQIKEKFGSLRIYSVIEKIPDFKTSDIPVEVYKIIADAMVKSENICDVCGKPGRLRNFAWLRTLCDEHAAEISRRFPD